MALFRPPTRYSAGSNKRTITAIYFGGGNPGATALFDGGTFNENSADCDFS